MSANAPLDAERLTIVEMMQQYGTEDACHEALEELRWPDGVECPKCGGKSISRIKTRRQFDCNGCRHQFSVRAGTIFHDSHLPLSKWFVAVYMMVESKKGISANQIKRMLGVSYKTAWYLCHRIRAAMKEDAPDQLSGQVEIDDTFVGGRTVGKGHENAFSNKEVVIGAVERGGRVRTRHLPNRGKVGMSKFIEEQVADETASIYTDKYWREGSLGDEDTIHRTVNHSHKEWVLPGDVHTNTIEGVWALLKRSISGSYHKLSAKHLQAYLDEMTWRYNGRENPFLFRDTLIELVNADPVEYRNLVSRS